MLTFRKALAMPLLALVAACGGKGYDLPASEVRDRLSHSRPPMMVFGGAVNNVMTTRTGDGGVRWTLLDARSSAVMRLTATIEENGENASTVTVDVEPPENGKNERIARNMAENPEIVSLYKAAMVEQIDATLTNRSFNMGAIQSQLMAATIKSIPQIQNQAMEAQRQWQESDREAAADEFANGSSETDWGK